ncbi:MAG: hypothetical protein J1E16_01630 [Muribaculaceae bacterium]|nr:hypothetical protein [Muribaculaceae bacterium]
MSFKLSHRLLYFYKGHITNWFWKDKLQRRRIRNSAYAEMILKSLSGYLPFIHKMVPDPSLKKMESSEEYFFTSWLQGETEAPEIIKKCLKSQRRLLGDKLIVLDNSNLDNYIDKSQDIKEKWENGIMSAAHYSDIVRLELLYKYGGYWLDATLFFTGPINHEIINSDFFMLSTSPKLLGHTLVQNYFIRAKKGDPLLKMWKDLLTEYWSKENEAKDYYVSQYLFRLLVENNEYAKYLYDKMPKVSIDKSQILWREIGNVPYNEELYRKMCEESFFQKCSYKMRKELLHEIIEGSMADYVLNDKVEV